MKFKINGKRYIWRPEVMVANMVTYIGMIVCAAGMGFLFAFWFVSLL